MFCINALHHLPWVASNCPHSIRRSLQTQNIKQRMHMHVVTHNKCSLVVLPVSTAEMHEIIGERQWTAWETQAMKVQFSYFSLKLLFLVNKQSHNHILLPGEHTWFPSFTGFICGLTPLFRVPSVGSAFSFHLNKCQVHCVFKNNGASGFICPV